MHEVFPDIPVFPAFGNNDLPGPYILPNNSDWYKTVLSYWAPLILCSECPDDVQRPTTMETLNETFLDGGYYSVNIEGRSIRELQLIRHFRNERKSGASVISHSFVGPLLYGFSSCLVPSHGPTSDCKMRVIHLLSLVNAVSPGLSKFQAQRKFVQRMESFRNRG